MPVYLLCALQPTGLMTASPGFFLWSRRWSNWLCKMTSLTTSTCPSWAFLSSGPRPPRLRWETTASPSWRTGFVVRHSLSSFFFGLIPPEQTVCASVNTRWEQSSVWAEQVLWRWVRSSSGASTMAPTTLRHLSMCLHPPGVKHTHSIYCIIH